MIILTHNYPTKENPLAGVFIDDHTGEIFDSSSSEARVVNLPYGEKMSLSPTKVIKLLAYVFRSIAVIKKLAKLETDKVIVHWWIPLGWIAAWRFRSPVHVVCHGTDLLFCNKHRMFASLLARHARRVEQWQCVSEHMATMLCDIYPFIKKSHITVRPMPVSKLFQDRQQSRKSNHFISIGPLIDEKGHKEAVSWLAENHPGSHLLVVGQGDSAYQEELLAHAKQTGLEIEFRQPVSREELADIFNRYEGLLTFSKHEGYGLVCREAQACGCKVIGYVGDGRTEDCVDEIVKR